MKKKLLVSFLLLSSMFLSAHDYQHGFGLNIGSQYGLTYKGFIFGRNDLALQVDAGINLWGTAGMANHQVKNLDTGSMTKRRDSFTSMAAYDLQINPNILYQRVFKDADFGTASWYVGGGVNIGYMRQSEKAQIRHEDWDYFPMMIGKAMRGKAGVNAIAGVELHFRKVPMTLSFDYRPGYGIGWAYETYEHYKNMLQLHFYDWSLAVGLRYSFNSKHNSLTK
ncbi:MAG: hypothetical protein MJZ75_00975 [Paludibacteraceae bacterium]|nr:hypothetical protein [Paludibacteraceae bacterium]